MRQLVRLAGFVIVVGALLTPRLAHTSPVFWTDWTTPGPGMVMGDISTTDAVVGVTYTGPYSFAQTGGGAYTWDFPIYDVAGPGSRPSTTDLVALDAAGTHSIQFSTPVADPYLAIMSLGRSSLPVSYSFSTPFTVVSEGLGWWGDGSYTTSPDNMTLTGYEMHGVIQFSGTFDELTWRSDPSEYWHGITVGVTGSAVPEPGTLGFLAIGLLGLGRAALRRRNENT